MPTESWPRTSSCKFCGLRHGTLEACSIRPHEPECPIVERLDLDLAFMHQPMVEAAERHKIRELRLATIGPVLHMVTVEIAFERTAGESTTLVPGIQGPSDRWRDGPRLAPDIERLAPLVFNDPDNAGVAREPPRSLGGDRGPVFEFAATCMTVFQRLGIHVHYDLLPISAREILRA